MACGICGNGKHNRRTHDKHVPPQGEVLLDQPAEVAEVSGADRARAALKAGPPQVVSYEGPAGGPATEANHPRAIMDLLGALQASVDRARSGRLAASNEGRNQDTPPTSPGPDAGQAEVTGEWPEDLYREAPEPYSDPEAINDGDHTGDLIDVESLAPEVLEAVGRIGDEMAEPHGPGCTLLDPCDNCRSEAADRSPVRSATSGDQAPITADDIRAIPGVGDSYPFDVVIDGEQATVTEVVRCHHERCGHIDEGDCSQNCDDEDQGYTERHSDDPYPEQCEHTRCDHHEEAECGTECADLVPPWRTVLGPDEPIRITLPGVYELTADEYHDSSITGHWLSNSDAKQLIGEGCPAQFRYDRDHSVRKTSPAFALGHAWHAEVLGKGETIAVRPLVNPNDPDQVWDSWRTNAAKAWRTEQEEAGRAVILPDQAQIVAAMSTTVHRKPRAHELLSQPGRPEVALFWYCPVTGVPRRCLVDFLPDGVCADGIMRPVDLKSADSVAPTESMSRKLYDHGWHRQGATIADGIVALGLAEDVEMSFVVQSKTAPHLVTVVVLDTEAERIGAIENREALDVYARCIETGVWPDFADDQVIMGVPPWIARQYENEMEIS